MPRSGNGGAWRQYDENQSLAIKSHLVVGLALVAIAMICSLVVVGGGPGWFVLPVYFFGIWGGVETGRYLEGSLSRGEGLHPRK